MASAFILGQPLRAFKLDWLERKAAEQIDDELGAIWAVVGREREREA